MEIQPSSDIKKATRKKQKPIHPGEDDKFIPQEIRGNHYDSWKEIAKDLGYKED